jgi:methyl-accepting chemotaxis protein
MASSVTEISRQVQESARMALSRRPGAATNDRVSELSKAAPASATSSN